MYDEIWKQLMGTRSPALVDVASTYPTRILLGLSDEHKQPDHFFSLAAPTSQV